MPPTDDEPRVLETQDVASVPLAVWRDGRYQFLRLGSLARGEPVYADDEALGKAVAGQAPRIVQLEMDLAA